MAKKKSDDKSSQQKQRSIVRVPAPETPVYYANNAHVDLSNFDVRLRFGQIVEAAPTELRITEVAHVFMSHSHFMAFAAIVGQMAERIAAAAHGEEKESTH